MGLNSEDNHLGLKSNAYSLDVVFLIAHTYLYCVVLYYIILYLLLYFLPYVFLACYNMNQWSVPRPGQVMQLPLLGQLLHVRQYMAMTLLCSTWH